MNPSMSSRSWALSAGTRPSANKTIRSVVNGSTTDIAWQKTTWIYVLICSPWSLQPANSSSRWSTSGDLPDRPTQAGLL
jgi:hypothetical protein